VKYITSSERQHYLKHLFGYLGTRANEIFVINSNKPTKALTKIFSNNSFNEVFDTPYAKTSIALTRQKHNIKNASAFTKRDQSTLDIFQLSLTSLKQKKLDGESRQQILPVFTAQLLSDYIAEQVGAPENQKSSALKHKVLSGIAKFTISLLKRVKLSKSNIISGLKVECSGK
jgi:UTP:GlnB (protein PII) uridylyltransferase